LSNINNEPKTANYDAKNAEYNLYAVKYDIKPLSVAIHPLFADRISLETCPNPRIIQMGYIQFYTVVITMKNGLNVYGY